MRNEEQASKETASNSSVSAPTITLPKGGGAIRGMGEKFSANPVTGTGSMSVPIATSPGRSGFGPSLSLSYDSGAGNGPFGFGWNLSIPSITRKTDKGLPKYFDAQDSDIFILSGAEDLVPEFEKDVAGNWVFNAGKHVIYDKPHTVDGVTYTVRRYRPRTEGLFARIERWARNDGDVHWRSISKDNILTLYGSDTNSRIFDPEDANRIFSWLICETRDDKGNAVLYEYKPEDGVDVELGRANERNRGARDDTRRTANRYLKRIYYGNRTSLLDNAGHRPSFLSNAQITNAAWMFEAVFDYGEHDLDAPKPNDAGAWNYRPDPFSSYRSGFEVRTTRLCQRVLMFHHFNGEAGVDNNCLVRSTDFTYSYEEKPKDARNPIYSFLLKVTQTGYRRNNGGYEKRSLPPVEFEYTQPIVQDAVYDVDPESLENLPIGVDGSTYQWTDLHGEGIPGILSEQADAWFYKRNLSPASEHPVEFAPLERVASKPNLSLAGGAQIMDMAGDGQPDLVVMEGPMPGLYEHDTDEGWQPFRPFTSRLNRNTRDPNLKFVDLDGDGHADVLITEDDAFVWHASLAEEGFGPARRVAQALDEEKGPRLVFADGTQSIYLSDMSGDGLTDLVRIRNGEVCYWPNLGYCRFGAKVTMDSAPHFDNPDQFDHKRIRLADIDGSGTTDIIYLHRDGVKLYFNQSGNSWSVPQTLRVFPRIDDIASIVPTDLLGNGTACLVWSSALPGDARRQMRYVNLMGDKKPHLLFSTINNLGAETQVQYAPSTKFYLKDKREGKPWITKLPFPVHVVEKVETYDHISRNRFVTRYAYHHGYFDGVEREFRGFGMVEQWDTEQIAALIDSVVFPVGDNVAAESHVPPVHTKTWFHTGVYLGRDRISNFFAGLLDDSDVGEYYPPTRSGDAAADAVAKELLLDDTILPTGLTLDEEREACRSLKGAMLRQEVYALDGTPKQDHPYTVTEQNFTIECLQPHENNRHGVFFTHPREAISFHYERNPVDPRIQHAFTLEVDSFGNVLQSAAIAYGRRIDSPDAALLPEDREKQRLIHITCTENDVTNPIVNQPDSYRTPLPAQARTYELRKAQQERSTNGSARLYRFEDVATNVNQAGDGAHDILYEDIEFAQAKLKVASNAGESNKYFRRLIEQVRTLYRKDDLTGLLPLKQVGKLALPGESYKLAFTPGLLDQVFQRPLANQNKENLLPAPAAVLSGQGEKNGGYLQSQVFKADGRFPNTDPDDHWWIPSGQSCFTETANEDPTYSAATELTEAQQHFFLPRRYRDPFGQDAFVSYTYDLLMKETRDALGNKVTVEINDYRVLQPRLVSDPNRNRTEVAFDTLGMVAGTAVMGKPAPAIVEGDSLVGFIADLNQVQIDGFHNAADPHTVAPPLLQKATTRIVYDLDRFLRTQAANPDDPTKWLPPYAATLARETHANDPLPPQGLKIQISFSYSDGFGREIQKKIQAEPEKVGGVVGSPRWVGSGWTIFNNKGKPVRQYEPFFSQLPPAERHHFEFGVIVGVSPVLFYDPAERVIATLHPNNTYEKVVFDPWQQTTYDVNDTVAPRNTQTSDPRTDPDIKGYVAEYFKALPVDPLNPWKTWHQQRINGDKGPHEQVAAQKTAAHADTPTTAHFDALGRPFLTLARNRVVCNGHALNNTENQFATRVELDIEGNQRAVRDAIEQGGDKQGRIVMRYAYNMLGNRVYQLSMEAGARWMLNDVAGKPIRAWDSRGHNFVTAYDALRRPVKQYVRGTFSNLDPLKPNSDSRTLNRDILVDQIEYGEGLANAEDLNLRTRIYRHYDSAGIATNAALNPISNKTEAYDFKGNLLRSTRQLVSQYREIPDWSLNPQPTPDKETFTSSTRYDALNRPTQSIAPHSDVLRGNPAQLRINIIQPVFNEANLLERVDVWLEHAAEPAGLLNAKTEAPSAVGISNIDYDAKGQRQRIDYKNGASTFYDYDPLTFRLTRLRTTRAANLNGLASSLFNNNGTVQDLRYTYDPAGNITEITDDALKTVFYSQEQVDPVCSYVYDALYRLIEGRGREHIGQSAFLLNSPNGNYRDHPYTGASQPGDPQAVRNYTEQYVYDPVGNFGRMIHQAANGGWSRAYAYNEASLTEPAKQSNRLSNTTLGGNNPVVEPYTHDAHGNMVRMPHLGGGLPDPNMHWDYKDQLHKVNLGGGGTAYYVYDASGQRVRKVCEKAPGLTEERIYLGGFEIFRSHGGAIGTDTATLERETLHIMDDKQRIALVETRTLGNDPAPQQLIRYQFGNHLGSASLELDEQAQIISYEEYTPYGCSSYHAVRSQTETAKRYRYTGKERDEESGLYYHGARYYAAWMGRWASCDPAGTEGGMQLYCYVRSNPIYFKDADGKVPAPYEVADSWEQKQRDAIGVTGESIAQGYSSLGDQLGDASIAAGEVIIEQVGIKNEFLKSAIRFTKVLEATVVKSAFDVGGGIVGAVVDPGMAIRGIMRFGTGTAQGVNDIQAGNTVLGVSRIVGEGSQAVGMALGGVQLARTFGVPGTYQPPRPAPAAPAAPEPVPATKATPGPNKARGPARQGLEPNLRELPEGQVRTPKENAAARRFYRDNRETAMRRWEERTGQKWPTDPEMGQPQWAEHGSLAEGSGRALTEGGDPLNVKPGVGPDPNAPHNVLGPDGLTDAQRWGSMGGRATAAKKKGK